MDIYTGLASSTSAPIVLYGPDEQLTFWENQAWLIGVTAFQLLEFCGLVYFTVQILRLLRQQVDAHTMATFLLLSIGFLL